MHYYTRVRIFTHERVPAREDKIPRSFEMVFCSRMIYDALSYRCNSCKKIQGINFHSYKYSPIKIVFFSECQEKNKNVKFFKDIKKILLSKDNYRRLTLHKSS